MNINNKMESAQVLFVGQLFPESMTSKIMEQEILPIQTQRFGKALVDALRVGFEENVEVLSTAPLVDFPHSRMILAPKSRWIIDNKIPATMMSYLNIVGLKQITRWFGTFIFVSWWILRKRDARRVILLHGVQSCKLWGLLFAQVFGRCSTISYLTDDLGISLSWEKSLMRKMRDLDVYLMVMGLQKASGVIAMTRGLAEKLAPGVPVLIMPTIRQSAVNAVQTKTGCLDLRSFNIVYTGKLCQSYGLELLLNAFAQAKRPNWYLLISGWGEMEEQVRGFARNNPQVEYFGLLSSEELLELRQRADVLVNPKLTSTSTSDLAFPSKIVEYLSTGKPVVSTNLPIFDSEFRKHLVIAQSDSPEELIRCLDQVMLWNESQREAWRVETIRFVNEELSPHTQGKRIREFADSLDHRN
jgi:glycosyltransferase involved in cell wall biosynthesis